VTRFKRIEFRAEPFLRFLQRYDQEKVIKSVFFGLLAGVAITLFLDYRNLAQMNALADLANGPALPVLPASSGDRERSAAPVVATPDETLRQQLAIELERGGILRLAGTIYPGAADAFRHEIDRVGEYVKQVELDSPGGSVDDAIAISSVIRDKGFTTLVRKGALCASSCPLIFAGGMERVAEDGASVGVHQIYAVDGSIGSPVDAMASAQITTARISRHLGDMDVDPALWTHAMETPPTRLYYLSAAEMADYRLTGASEAAAGE
jgi:hypothetical protein